jgi:hypothetical protein
LNDTPGFLRCRGHLHTFRGSVRHGLFDVDVLACADRVHDDLFVPMIGHGSHDAIDVLVLQQFVIATGGRQIGAIDNLFG